MWIQNNRSTYVNLYLRIEVCIGELSWISFYEKGKWVTIDPYFTSDMERLKEYAILEWMHRPAQKDFRKKSYARFNSSKVKRLTLEFSEKSYNRLLEIQARKSKESVEEVIRTALKLYDYVTAQHDDGWTVAIEKDNIVKELILDS